MMNNIDATEAAKALSDIKEIVHRVRQSRIYDLAGEIMMLWGALVLAGNLATYGWPRYGGYIWTGVNVLGMAGMAVLSTFGHRRTGIRSLDLRMVAAFVMILAFGFCGSMLGHFGPRELGTFWPLYFMLFYCLAGLWLGFAFLAIGLLISALVLTGYFFVSGGAFLLWMAAVNGGGLILCGLWMRRV